MLACLYVVHVRNFIRVHESQILQYMQEANMSWPGKPAAANDETAAGTSSHVREEIESATLKSVRGGEQRV